MQPSNDYRFHTCSRSNILNSCFKQHKRHVDQQSLATRLFSLDKKKCIEYQFQDDYKHFVNDNNNKDIFRIMPFYDKFVEPVVCRFRQRIYAVGEQETDISINIWDNNTICAWLSRNLYRDRPLRLLASDQYLALACVKGLNDGTAYVFHQQLLFRMRHRANQPSMITVQVHGPHTQSINLKVLINKHILRLCPLRYNDQFGEYYIGTSDNYKKYSSIKHFKELFINEKGQQLDQVHMQFNFKNNFFPSLHVMSKPTNDKQCDFYSPLIEYQPVNNHYIYERDFGYIFKNPLHPICNSCRKRHGKLTDYTHNTKRRKYRD